MKQELRIFWSRESRTRLIFLSAKRSELFVVMFQLPNHGNCKQRVEDRQGEGVVQLNEYAGETKRHWKPSQARSSCPNIHTAMLLCGQKTGEQRGMYISPLTQPTCISTALKELISNLCASLCWLPPQKKRFSWSNVSLWKAGKPYVL